MRYVVEWIDCGEEQMVEIHGNSQKNVALGGG